MRTNELSRLLNIHKDKIDLYVAAADGDCFYSCIKKVIDVSIDDLRCLVASSFTEDIYDTYKALCDFYDDLSWIKRCKSLDQARELVSIPKLVWADEHAIKAVIDTYDITLLIINEGNRESKTSMDRIGYGHNHIILNRTRRSHYNLITLQNTNDEEIQQIHQQFVQRLL